LVISQKTGNLIYITKAMRNSNGKRDILNNWISGVYKLCNHRD